MSSRLRPGGAVVRAVHDSEVGSHPMIQGRGSDRSPVARIPQVAVESDRRGVAVQTPRHDMARNQSLDQTADRIQR